jgi:hypothetical protein
MIDVLTIEAILHRMDNLRRNRKRGFTILQFAKFAGVDYRNLKKMCYEGSIPITPSSQRKISRALLALENGEAGLRRNIANQTALGYHPPKEQGPTMRRGLQINLSNGGVSLVVKPVNKYDFSKRHILTKGD